MGRTLAGWTTSEPESVGYVVGGAVGAAPERGRRNLGQRLQMLNLGAIMILQMLRLAALFYQRFKFKFFDFFFTKERRL